MERGSDKHSPRVDEELEHETRSLEQGAPIESRVEEYREQGTLAGMQLDAFCAANSMTLDAATLSMIHGIRMNRLAIGGGVAFDGYRNWNVVPVFGSASYDVVRIKSNALFVQLNVDYSFSNRITDTEQMFNNYNAYGSQMINSMVGYRIKAKQYSLYMQVGHKYQVVHYKFDPMPSWSSFWMPAVSVEENLNRFVVAIGLGLN